MKQRACSVLLFLLCVCGIQAGCNMQHGLPDVKVEVEEIVLRDVGEFSLDSYKRANDSMRSYIDCVGASGSVDCYLAPRGVGWVRVKIFYSPLSKIESGVLAKMDDLRPIPRSDLDQNITQ